MDEDKAVPYEAAEIRAERVLALAAHPDDEVFGAGGLLAALASSAEAVRVVVFTGGEAQEKPQRGSADPEARRREAREAGSVLGISDYVFLDFADRSLGEKRREVAEALKRAIADFAPDLLVAPSPTEIHPDHRALGEAVYEAVASSRPGDAGHELGRFLHIAYYEISQPILPNALVPLGENAGRKRAAMEKFASQALVRDYTGAMSGLNAYRALTLSGAGPTEAFRLVDYPQASTTSLEEFRRAIGPGALIEAGRQTGPAGAVVRTKNRPLLVREAVESLAAQKVRPRRVVVVNDGGTSPRAALAPFREAFDLVFVEHPASRGRSAAGNAGASRLDTEAFSFLDDDDLYAPDHFDRLLAARAAGPEPIVYSDAVTVLLAPEGEGWKERHRTLQYSLDFDAEYLLFANYIPLHTVLFDAALFAKAGGFDEAFDYSEDWDLLIRLSREAPFRHIRAVTAQYRIFEGESGHVAAGEAPFLAARQRIVERHRGDWNGETVSRVLDRFARRLARIDEKEREAAGELVYQRSSHRRLAAKLEAAETEARRRIEGLEEECRSLAGQVEALKPFEPALAEASAKITELFAEIARLNDLIRRMEGTKAWRLHLFMDRLRHSR